MLKGRPLWHTDFLPAMFIATGLIGSVGLLLVLDRFSGTRAAELSTMPASASVPPSRPASRQLLGVLLFACILAGITAALWFAVGLTQRDPSVAEALRSVQDNPDWRAMTFREVATGGILFWVFWCCCCARKCAGWRGYSAFWRCTPHGCSAGLS